MDLVDHATHVREFRIGQHGARLIAIRFVSLFFHPTIVDVHIHVAVIGHPRFDHRGSRISHVLFVHTEVMDIPTIPTHRRCERQGIAYHQREDFGALPMFVTRVQRQPILTRLARHCPANNT